MQATIKDTGATAYFASISQVLSQAQQPGTKIPDIEVLAYCYAAVVSNLEMAVIQNQHAEIFNLVKSVLLGPEASDYTSKYGLIALQFLLHSKTQAQWQAGGGDAETEHATHLLLSFLVDPKKKKSQKQAVKSICLMLKNRNIDKQPILTK